MKKRNRLIRKLEEQKKKAQKVFCAFLTLGYPSLAATSKLIESFEREGVDLIELGFPFSDPLADGPTIQFSSEWALRLGVKMQDAFQQVRDLRKKGVEIPIVFFSYLNPIHHYGIKRFVLDAKKAGFDGLIVPDCPPEEEKLLQKICCQEGLSQVFLVAPTTLKPRMKMIVRHSEGFIYYVSLRGVTGARKSLPIDIKRPLDFMRRQTNKPVLIGFGVSTPKQGRRLAKLSQGVIVGSAIIDHLRNSRGRLSPTVRFVRTLVNAVKKHG
ncbi:MAG: tryptophan synthase subunit alpha [Candidatus Omnitrophica bacterium]|nr:tryptophan synthase subunit alpha [Candidatus Omnitrophota bacterium]